VATTGESSTVGSGHQEQGLERGVVEGGKEAMQLEKKKHSQPSLGTGGRNPSKRNEAGKESRKVFGKRPLGEGLTKVWVIQDIWETVRAGKGRGRR